MGLEPTTYRLEVCRATIAPHGNEGLNLQRMESSHDDRRELFKIPIRVYPKKVVHWLMGQGSFHCLRHISIGRGKNDFITLMVVVYSALLATYVWLREL
mmetsp:Transcript_11405/g.16820  ORF Transcript_11405/g.16820 Transcript_11405/m.16820 type:complete len:99 (-) Transcript_11405:184-480(-)